MHTDARTLTSVQIDWRTKLSRDHAKLVKASRLGSLHSLECFLFFNHVALRDKLPTNWIRDWYDKCTERWKKTEGGIKWTRGQIEMLTLNIQSQPQITARLSDGNCWLRSTESHFYERIDCCLVRVLLRARRLWHSRCWENWSSWRKWRLMWWLASSCTVEIVEWDWNQIDFSYFYDKYMIWKKWPFVIPELLSAAICAMTCSFITLIFPRIPFNISTIFLRYSSSVLFLGKEIYL